MEFKENFLWGVATAANQCEGGYLEEAQAALEAQKQAELAAKAAQQACEEAEKQAQEAEAAKLKIEQETKKKLAALKRRK